MKKYLEYIWITLLILTIFAYFLGHFKLISTSLVGVLLLTTFIKGALVSDYFMGLKQVSTKYRVVPIIWLAVVICFIGVAYYLPL